MLILISVDAAGHVLCATTGCAVSSTKISTDIIRRPFFFQSLLTPWRPDLSNITTMLRLPRRLHHTKCYFINRINNFIRKRNNQWRTQEFFSGEGGSTQEFFPGGFNKFSRGQRERGSGGGNPLFRDSGGSYNLVQKISFHIVKFLNFWHFKTTYFGSALSKLRNFGGGGFEPPNLPRCANGNNISIHHMKKITSNRLILFPTHKRNPVEWLQNFPPAEHRYSELPPISLTN
jgi:hypothetical protein